MSTFSIAQINARNSPTLVNNFPMLRQSNCKLIAISEPPLNAPFSDERYIYETPNVSGRPRVAFIILDHSIKYSVNTHSRFLMEITLIDIEVTIFLAYIPPPFSPDKDHIPLITQSLLSIISSQKSNSLILGDLNAHPESSLHPANPQGLKFHNSILAANWKLLNHLDEPTFIPSNPHLSSITDWSISSDDISRLCTWQIFPDSSLSDHVLIIISLLKSLPPPPTKTYVSINALKDTIRSLQSPQHLSDAIDLINQAVQSSTRPISFRYKQPWFTHECELLKKQIIKLKNQKRKLKSKNLPQNQPNEITSTIKSLSKKYKSLVIKSKLTYETRLFQPHNSTTSTFRYSTAIKNRTKKPINYILHDDQIIVDPHQIASLAIPYFFPTSPSPSSCIHLPTSSSTDDPPIQLHEIKRAIKDQKPSAPGSDNINIHLMHSIFQTIPTFILDLFNLWLREGFIPATLKKASLVLIYKDPKKKPTLNNIRPIALTSFLSRIFERIILNRINFHLYHFNLFPKDQFAHKKQSSIEHALLPIHNFIKSYPSNYAILCFDIANAYNNVSHQSIINNYASINLPPNLIKIIASLLSDREISMHSSSAKLHKGIFQGAILSPINFNIAIMSSLQTFRSSIPSYIQYQLITYSDDINIIFTNWHNTDNLETFILHLFESLETSIQTCGLSLAKQKTQFTTMIGNVANRQISWKNLSLNTSSHVRILGVFFEPQSKLKYSFHLKEKKNKAIMALNSLHPVLRSRLVPKETKIIIINSCIYPIITFCSSFIFDSILHFKSFISYCSSIDRLIAIKTFKLPSNISSAATFASLYPTSLYTTIISSVTRRKLQLKITHLPSNLSFNQPSLRELHFHPSSIFSLPTFASYEHAINCHNFDYFYYTDASQQLCPPEMYLTIDAPPLGIAWALADSNNRFIAKFRQPIYQTASVFQAELYTIHLAIINIQKRNLQGKILIVTDSLSSISAINNLSSTCPQSIKIQKLILQLHSPNLEIMICHTKAHSGLRGNEYADSLAKSASSLNFGLYHLPLSSSALKKFANRSLLGIHEKIFQSLNGAHFKQFFPHTESIHSFTSNNYFSFFNIRCFSGHGPFIFRLFATQCIPSDLCPCNQPHSFFHMITSCPLLSPSLSPHFDISNLSSSSFPPSPDCQQWKSILQSSEMKKFIVSASPTIFHLSKAALLSKYPEFSFHSLI